jgi:hypothetical protein
VQQQLPTVFDIGSVLASPDGRRAARDPVLRFAGRAGQAANYFLA